MQIIGYLVKLLMIGNLLELLMIGNLLDTKQRTNAKSSVILKLTDRIQM